MVVEKKGKILIKIKGFNNLNKEMKMRILMRSIKGLSGKYYSPRASKIFNKIEEINSTKNKKFTLGGCYISSEKNHIILIKEGKY